MLNYEDTQKNKQKYKATLEYDNLFGINDNLYFSYRGDVRKLTKDHKDDYTEAYSVGYSFPVKSWTLGFSFNKSREKNLILGRRTNYTLLSKSSVDWKSVV